MMPLPLSFRRAEDSVHPGLKGMLLAVRIPLISDHDRFVARLFRVQVNEAGRELGAWARRQQINVLPCAPDFCGETAASGSYCPAGARR